MNHKIHFKATMLLSFSEIRLLVPSVVHVIQSPASVPQPTPHYTNPTYPTSSAGISQPPSYSEVVYEKQAPYNPNYTSSTQQ
ncbi:hypothetical protein E2986_11920 [Frieseomelitta varia]|uniref:Uncharacterized protein n=1 Tax=Frieseomelitta varia TaxID=561572 RepID=A0A833RIC2_9HYME|nr:hypothetical protein E2986_11920 [Frieseomelitta varia]